MKSKFVAAALMAMTVTPAVMPSEASAQRHHHRYHTYYGRSGHYRHRCGGGNGAVGTIAGGVGGGLIGSAIGGPVATVAGAVGGGLLGRHLDKQHTRARHGC